MDGWVFSPCGFPASFLIFLLSASLVQNVRHHYVPGTATTRTSDTDTSSSQSFSNFRLAPHAAAAACKGTESCSVDRVLAATWIGRRKVIMFSSDERVEEAATATGVFPRRTISSFLISCSFTQRASFALTFATYLGNNICNLALLLPRRRLYQNYDCELQHSTS